MHRDLFLDTLTDFAECFERTVKEEIATRFEAAQRQAVIDHIISQLTELIDIVDQLNDQTD